MSGKGLIYIISRVSYSKFYGDTWWPNHTSLPFGPATYIKLAGFSFVLSHFQRTRFLIVCDEHWDGIFPWHIHQVGQYLIGFPSPQSLTQEKLQMN